jgi:two-component system, LytTR family, response regulator LytT
MRIVIIEDEKLTAKDLAQTIRAIEPDCEILPFLHSVEDGLAYFQQQPQIDLIFSDIDLGDGLSFEIFEKFDVAAPVVFCTAHQEYTLEAFRYYGIDYVLKPFNKQALGRTLQKFRTLQEKLSRPKSIADLSAFFRGSKDHGNPDQRVLVYQADRIIPLRADEVALFYIEEEAVYALTFERKKHLLTQRLDVLEESFAGNFFRANRQYLVNRKAVKDASQSFNRKLRINLSVPFDQEILVGKLKHRDFLAWLSGAPS